LIAWISDVHAYNTKFVHSTKTKVWGELEIEMVNKMCVLQCIIYKVYCVAEAKQSWIDTPTYTLNQNCFHKKINSKQKTMKSTWDKKYRRKPLSKTYTKQKKTRGTLSSLSTEGFKSQASLHLISLQSFSQKLKLWKFLKFFNDE